VDRGPFTRLLPYIPLIEISVACGLKVAGHGGSRAHRGRRACGNTSTDALAVLFERSGSGVAEVTVA
jgi:hypothetical protein